MLYKLVGKDDEFLTERIFEFKLHLRLTQIIIMYFVYLFLMICFSSWMHTFLQQFINLIRLDLKN